MTGSLGVTVRDSSRKMLVLLDLARRKSREILEHGVRRVASQGESWRFLGKSRELALGSQALKGQRRGQTGNARLGFWKSRELLLSLAVGKTDGTKSYAWA